MSDGSLPDRLTQLRSRWEADPASRIFLQLAEEYRHQGRLQEALGVLDQGLREHPGYLSALVAKGRCLLDLGQPEPAREVLERVVRQDATQMVANKLLVRTYLETGQAARARERLDLYSLLHDGDPEIEDLRSRIERMTGPPGPSSAASGAAEDDVFDLAAPVPAAPRGDSRDVFDLPLPNPAPAIAPVARAVATPVPAPAAPLPAAPAPRPAAVAVQVAVHEAPAGDAVPRAPQALQADEDELEPVAEGEPFAGVVSRTVRRRHFAALVAEGIFDLAPPAWATAARPAATEPEHHPEHQPERELQPEAWPGPVPAVEPERAVETPREARLEPEPVVESEPEPAVAAPVAEPPQAAAAPPAWAAGGEVATATLGELYLRQGHAGEAERIFGEVLAREPGNVAAHDGLARVRSLGEPAPPLPEAPPALEPEPPAPIPLDRKAKKMQALSSYLDRIRRGSGRHVS